MFGYFIVFMIIVMVAIFVAWLYQPSKVLTLNNVPFPTRVVHQSTDSVLILNVDYCKNVRASGTIRISFVSSSREIFLPLAKENRPPGCHKQDLPILLPVGLPPDRYVLKFQTSYDINPLKKNVTSEFESQEFTVHK
jgi:hypothetical protein